jgi:NADH-quinone oxidoreductase subunit J
MIAQNVSFGIIAAAMAGGALGVVRTKNVVHAALYLVVVLGGGAAQFILLGQEFVAWVQVLVYIGAVIVLFLFGIMLTRAPMGKRGDFDNDQRWPALVVAVFLLGVVTALLVDAFGNDKIHLNDQLLESSRTGAVGNEIFRNFVIPFEVVSMLLLAALVGAVVIARRD